MKLPFQIKPIHWILVGAVLVLLMAAGYYNSFVTKVNGIDGQWKQVEVQYQRRFDLIPNLVESVKGIQKQEQVVFGAVNDARTAYAGAKTPADKVVAANQLEGSLSRLIAVFENYPQIKSDQAVLRLMDELSGTENRISVERRRYNELVQSYNTSISVIPGRLLAGIFGYSPREYFKTVTGSDTPPQVKF